MKTTLILPIPLGKSPLVAVHDLIREKDPLFKHIHKSVERTIHLARILKVPAADLSKYLKVQIGGPLSEEDIIAVKKSLFAKTTVKSPEKGILKSIDLTAGTITLECESGSDTKESDNLSSVSGKVIRISDGEIEIETDGHTVVGKKSSGSEVSGILTVVDLPKITLYDTLPDLVSAIALVSEVESDVLTKLDVMGVKGLVVRHEIIDSPLPWVLIDEGAFEKLKKHHGKKVMLSPEKNTVVLI